MRYARLTPLYDPGKKGSHSTGMFYSKGGKTQGRKRKGGVKETRRMKRMQGWKCIQERVTSSGRGGTRDDWLRSINKKGGGGGEVRRNRFEINYTVYGE